MAQIGAFTLKDGTSTGPIRTMTINVKAHLVPDKKRQMAHLTSGSMPAAASRARRGARTRKTAKHITLP